MIENKESNVRKTQASFLEGKTYSVFHLPSTLQIFKNTNSSFAHLIILVVWLFFPLSFMNLLYILDMKPLPNMWFAKFFFSFHRLSFHFNDGFFYCAQGIEFDAVPTSLFCSSCLCFRWLSCLSCLHFGKQSFISCFICCYLLPFLPKDSDWLNGYKNKTHIYVVYKRPTSVLETHTGCWWGCGEKKALLLGM